MLQGGSDKHRVCNPLQGIVDGKDIQPFYAKLFHMFHKTCILQRSKPAAISIRRERNIARVLEIDLAAEIDSRCHLLLIEENKFFLVTKILLFFKKFNRVNMVLFAGHDIKRQPSAVSYTHLR